jgi:HK97 gp10 family phage protein
MTDIGVTIKVQGIDEIRNAFAKFPEIVGPFLRDASLRAALFLEGESKKRSPVDTGRLRSSIATSLGAQDKGLTSIVSTNVFYAVFVHEGTKYMKKRQFMKKAVEENRDEISKIFQEQVTKGLEKVKSMAQ